MKKQIYSTITILTLITTMLACKSEKKNEAKAKAAQPIATTTSIANKYKAVITDSHIKWTGAKPLEKHTGTIAIESGIIKTINSKIVSGSFLIDMRSIIVTDLKGKQKKGLEEHLKGFSEGKEDHFFNVVKYPNAAFEITTVTENTPQTLIQGNLTIRGIKKNISFPATIAFTSDKIIITSDPFAINRTDWGINYGSKSIFDNLGDKFINDNIILEIQLVANKI